VYVGTIQQEHKGTTGISYNSMSMSIVLLVSRIISHKEFIVQFFLIYNINNHWWEREYPAMAQCNFSCTYTVYASTLSTHQSWVSVLYKAGPVGCE